MHTEKERERRKIVSIARERKRNKRRERLKNKTGKKKRKTHVGNPALRKISLCTSRKESTFKRSMSSCQHGRSIGGRLLLGMAFALFLYMYTHKKRKYARARALGNVDFFFVCRFLVCRFPKNGKSEHFVQHVKEFFVFLFGLRPNQNFKAPPTLLPRFLLNLVIFFSGCVIRCSRSLFRIFFPHLFYTYSYPAR